MVDVRRAASAKPTVSKVDGPDSLEALVPKRRIWPVLAVLGIVVLAVTLVVARELTATDPLRILVAIDLDGYWWEGSEPAAKLADALSSQLRELGFDPVKGGDPKVMKVLEKAKDPEAAARKLGAGFVIQAHLAPEVIEHPVKGGYFEVRVDAPIKLTFLDDGRASEGRLQTYAGAKERPVALNVLNNAIAAQALNAVIGQLLDHPAVVALMNGSDVKLLERLSPARVFGKERAKRLEAARLGYVATGKDHETSSKGATFYSRPDAEDRLIGAVPGGFLVKTADISTYFSLQHRDMVRSEALETITFRSFDEVATSDADAGAPATSKEPPMWRGYHVFTYPSSEPSGRVALVEDLFGWAKTITMTDRTGAAKRVRVDPEHRFVDPKLAPGGKFVAANDRPHPGEPADLLVLDTATGKEIYAYHPDQQALAGFAWIDATRLVASVVDDAGGGNVILVDAGKDPVSIERPFKMGRGKELSSPSTSADGKLVVWSLPHSAPGVAILDTTAWTSREFTIASKPAWPTFSPDSAYVVFEAIGDGGSDLGVLTVATRAVKRLTNTRNEERGPIFSADGKRVLFEVRYGDPLFPRVRFISRIASIPFEP